jgi:hypothetical protein
VASGRTSASVDRPPSSMPPPARKNLDLDEML